MKKKLLLFMLSMFIISTAFAQFIEVGDPNATNSNNLSPAADLWDYGWAPIIISAHYIGQSIEVSSLSYKVTDSPVNYEMTDQKVYFTHTEATTALTSHPDPASNNFDLVFDGDIVWDGNGWHEIILDTAFDYDGVSNLQIVWKNHDGSFTSNPPKFIKSVADFNIVAYKRTDNTLPDSAGSGRTYDYPNFRLGYFAEGYPEVATIVAPEDQSIGTITMTSYADAYQ